MAGDRVDKAWRSKGLDSFSSEAILGTLQHYGVPVDEAKFKSLADGKYPLQIATEWMSTWKGVGQFAGFPLAAAETLWARWFPDRTAPVTVSRALVSVLTAFKIFQEGDEGSPTEAALAWLERLLEKAPMTNGQLDNAFAEEVLTRLDPDTLQAFDEMAETLATAGHVEQAEAFARLEEKLVPERLGVATAIVQAKRGDKAGAAEQLLALSRDASASSDRRLLAVDALIHVGALNEAEARATEMFDAAEKENDFHLGLDLAGRLEHLYTKRRAEPELRALISRAQKLQDAHSHAHPHHRH